MPQCCGYQDAPAAACSMCAQGNVQPILFNMCQNNSASTQPLASPLQGSISSLNYCAAFSLLSTLDPLLLLHCTSSCSMAFVLQSRGHHMHIDYYCRCGSARLIAFSPTCNYLCTEGLGPTGEPTACRGTPPLTTVQFSACRAIDHLAIAVIPSRHSSLSLQSFHICCRCC